MAELLLFYKNTKLQRLSYHVFTRNKCACILTSMLCAGAEWAGLFHSVCYGGF